MEVMLKRFKWAGITSFKGKLQLWFTCLTLLVGLAAFIPFIIFGKEQLRENADVDMNKMINVQQVVT